MCCTINVCTYTLSRWMSVVFSLCVVCFQAYELALSLRFVWISLILCLLFCAIPILSNFLFLLETGPVLKYEHKIQQCQS